jgi:hypothetical protein
MKVGRALVTVALVLVMVACVLSGCERKTRTYAGITTPKPSETVNPHK